MANEIKVKFSVTSYEGDSEYEMLPKEALTYLRELEKEQSKWVFVGTEHKPTSLMTEDDLIEATSEKIDIIAVNAIAGGNEGLIKTKFNVDKKQKHSVVIDFEEHELGRIISISVSDKQLFPLLHNRDVIRRALQKEFTDKANAVFEENVEPMIEVVEDTKEQVQGLKKVLNL